MFVSRGRVKPPPNPNRTEWSLRKTARKRRGQEGAMVRPWSRPAKRGGRLLLLLVGPVNRVHQQILPFALHGPFRLGCVGDLRDLPIAPADDFIEGLDAAPGVGFCMDDFPVPEMDATVAAIAADELQSH